MYGTESYGTNQYAVNNTQDEIIPSNYKNNLIGNVHKIYRQDKWLNTIYKSAGIDLDSLGGNIQDLINQLNPSTATWGLNIWENELKINTDINKSYEERREVIEARLRGYGTTTKKMIENTAEAFSGGECNVIEHPENYSFTVQFVGVLGIPKNLEAFKEMLEIIKPAHLAYDFKYTYTIWDFIKNKPKTWDNIKTNTWDGLKVFSDN
ncbi:YmfQ family protein [Clostridium neuense]|uniref:YmfQ family protein n=1 Tax=Clostridium neuense TaxID=1728934 RepID=A0ABW8THH1_9CLOT